MCRRAPAWSWVEEGRLIAGRYPREDAVLAEWRGLGSGLEPPPIKLTPICTDRSRKRINL